jgi:hypothetical protein
VEGMLLSCTKRFPDIFCADQHISCIYCPRLKLQHIAHFNVCFRDARRISKFIATAYQQTFTHTGTSLMAFNQRFKPTGLRSRRNIIYIHILRSTQKRYLLSGMMSNNSTLSLQKMSFQARGRRAWPTL